MVKMASRQDLEDLQVNLSSSEQLSLSLRKQFPGRDKKLQSDRCLCRRGLAQVFTNRGDVQGIFDTDRIRISSNSE